MASHKRKHQEDEEDEIPSKELKIGGSDPPAITPDTETETSDTKNPGTEPEPDASETSEDETETFAPRCLDDQMRLLDKCVPDFCSGVLCAAPKLKVAGLQLRYPLSPTDCEALYRDAKQSAFGDRDKTVTDLKVRSSREYPASALTINPDHSNVWLQEWQDTVVSTATELFKQGTLTFAPQKLVIYAPGDFFTVHKDTIRSDTHVGTALLSLPVDGGFTGGTFTLQTSTGTKLLTSSNFSSRGLEAYFACFRTDVDHAVHPVESGYRVVLSFEVYGSDKRPQSLAEPKMKAALEKIHSEVTEALKQVNQVVIFTEHEYSNKTATPEKLHGAERLVYDHLTGKGLKVRVTTIDMFHGGYEDDDDIMTITGDRLHLSFPFNEDENGSDDVDPDRAAVLSHPYNEPGETLSNNRGGHTGNESAPSDYHYRHTALVIEK